MLHVVRVLRAEDCPSAEDAEDADGVVAIVEVTKQGCELPVFHRAVLKECAKLRTRGGRNKKRTKRDEAPEYARQISRIYVVDDATPKEVKAEVLMRSPHRVVRTSTPGDILPDLAALPDVDEGVPSLSMALACVWSGLFSVPGPRKGGPRREWLCVTSSPDDLSEWCKRMEREWGEMPIVIHARCEPAHPAEPRQQLQLPGPSLRATADDTRPSPVGVLCGEHSADVHALRFPMVASGVQRFMAYLHGLGVAHCLAPAGPAPFAAAERKSDAPQAVCKRMEHAAAYISPRGDEDVLLDDVVRVCGCVGYIRHTGPVAFITLRAEGCRVRVAAKGSQVDSGSAKALPSIVCGDMVWVEGRVGCTKKGKLTVFATVVRRQCGARTAPEAPSRDGRVEILPCAVDGVVAYHKPAGMHCVPVGNMQPKDYPTALQCAAESLGCRLAPLTTLPADVSGVCMAYSLQDKPPRHTLDRLLSEPIVFTYVALTSPDIAATAHKGAAQPAHTAPCEEAPLVEFAECRACLKAFMVMTPAAAPPAPTLDEEGIVKAVQARLGRVSEKECGMAWGAVNGTSSSTSGINRVFSKRYGLRRIGVHLLGVSFAGAGDGRESDVAVDATDGALRGVLESLPVARVFSTKGGGASSCAKTWEVVRGTCIAAPSPAILRAEILGDVAYTLSNQIGTIRVVTLLKLFPRIAEKLMHYTTAAAHGGGDDADLLARLLSEAPEVFAVAGDHVRLVSYVPGRVEELARPLADLIHRQILQSRHAVRTTESGVAVTALTVRLAVPLVGWRLKEFAYALGMPQDVAHALPSADAAAGAGDAQAEVKSSVLGQLAQQLVSFVSDSEACSARGIYVVGQAACPERRKAEMLGGGGAAHPEDCCCSWTVGVRETMATPSAAGALRDVDVAGGDGLGGVTHPTRMLVVSDAHRMSQLARCEMALLGWGRTQRHATGLHAPAAHPVVHPFSATVRRGVVTLASVDLRRQAPDDILPPHVVDAVRAAAVPAAGVAYSLRHEMHHDALAGALSAEQDLPFVSLHVLAAFTRVFARVLGPPAGGAPAGGMPAYTLHYVDRGRQVLLSRDEEPRDDITTRRHNAFLDAWEAKPFIFSGSMEGGVAAVIVHLALLSAGLTQREQWARARVVDGCCGSGTLSAAASFVFGCKVFAGELQADFAGKARENFAHLFQGADGGKVGGPVHQPELMVHDATAPYPSHYLGADIVLCNPPWGVNFGAESDSLPILLALARSFPDAVWCFVAPKHANDAFLMCDTPEVREVHRLTFGSVEVLIAKRREGAAA